MNYLIKMVMIYIHIKNKEKRKGENKEKLKCFRDIKMNFKRKKLLNCSSVTLNLIICRHWRFARNDFKAAI